MKSLLFLVNKTKYVMTKIVYVNNFVKFTDRLIKKHFNKQIYLIFINKYKIYNKIY